MKNKGNVPVDIKWRFKRFYKSSISARSDYGYGCILTTYGKIKNRLQAENISISDTTVRPRKDIYSFDYACVNEAVLNPLVHNDWTVTEPQISMFHDRLRYFLMVDYRAE